MDEFYNNSPNPRYKCVKCGNTACETDRFQATGGNFARVLDIQNKRFVTVTCTRCGYTELYKQMSDAGMDIIDFMFGN